MMRLGFVMAVLLAGSACSKAADSGSSAASSSGKASKVQTYKVLPAAAKDPITVEADIPSDWTVSNPSGNGPEIKVPGVDRGMISIAALSLSGTPEDRMKTAISAQYDDAAGAQRTDMPDGRVWMQRVEGTRLHARLFIPYGDGIVMGVAMIPQAAAEQLPAIRKVFETIKVPAAH